MFRNQYNFGYRTRKVPVFLNLKVSVNITVNIKKSFIKSMFKKILVFRLGLYVF